jgi:hypothetical protein
MEAFQKSEGGKKLVQGAMSLFTNIASSANASSSSGPAPGGSNGTVKANVVERTPEDIPREELLALCMKMNKRMSVTDQKANELAKRKGILIEERRQLLELIAMAVGVGEVAKVGEEEDLKIATITETWEQWHRANRQRLKTLENRISELESISSSTSSMNVSSSSMPSPTRLMPTSSPLDTLNADTTAISDSNSPVHSSVNGNSFNGGVDQHKILVEKCSQLEVEVEEATRKANYARNQVTSLESELRTKTDALTSLQRDLDTSISKKEEAILYLQLQLNKARDGEEGRDKEAAMLKKQMDALQAQVVHGQLQVEEKDSSLRSYQDMLVALQGRLEETETMLDRNKDRIKELERNINALTVLKAENESIVNNLRRELRSAVEYKEIAERSLKDVEQWTVKSDIQVAKISSLQEQVGELQVALDEKVSQITRMRSEGANNERNHAMRTAMLATCEAQIESLKQELISKELTAKEAVERVSMLQVRLSGAETRLEERVHEMNLTIEALEEQINHLKTQQREEIKALEEAQEAAIEAIKRENAKKSSAARTLLAEREEENRILTEKVKDMSAEIQSGAPSERRIFELAQLQAKRDAAYGTHR